MKNILLTFGFLATFWAGLELGHFIGKAETLQILQERSDDLRALLGCKEVCELTK